MKVKFGRGTSEYGTGVDIKLSGDEVAAAIHAYLVAHNIHVCGSRTTTVNGEMIRRGKVYVDPSGFVIANGVKYEGRNKSKTQ